MEKYDVIELIQDVDYLNNKNILKGFCGNVISIENKNCCVMFFNKLNLGEYIITNVDVQFLRVIGKLSNKIIKELEEKIDNFKINKVEKFSVPLFQKLDYVEVIVEKEQYAHDGVHKGMRGFIMEEQKILNYYNVVFSDPQTGLDIANLNILEDDLKKIE